MGNALNVVQSYAQIVETVAIVGLVIVKSVIQRNRTMSWLGMSQLIILEFYFFVK